jgi:hypothetical protein
MANRSPAMFKEDAQAIAVLDTRIHFLASHDPREQYADIMNHICYALISTTFKKGKLSYQMVAGINNHHTSISYSFEFYFDGLMPITCRGNLEPGTGPVCTNAQLLTSGSEAIQPRVANHADRCAGLAQADLAIMQTLGQCADKR